HPLNKLRLSNVVHVVSWLINQRQVGIGMHNFYHFDKPFLATRKGREGTMRHVGQLEIFQLTLDLLFNLVKSFIVKSLQGRRVFFNLLHAVAHRSGVGFNYMTKLWILREARQYVLQTGRIAHVMVLLSGRHDGSATTV